jgi:hypothetical protein
MLAKVELEMRAVDDHEFVEYNKMVDGKTGDLLPGTLMHPHPSSTL